MKRGARSLLLLAFLGVSVLVTYAMGFLDPFLPKQVRHDPEHMQLQLPPLFAPTPRS